MGAQPHDARPWTTGLFSLVSGQPLLLGLTMVLALSTAFAGCKPRDPNQAGLLTSADPAGAKVAPGGLYDITCVSSDAQEATGLTFRMAVKGAVDAKDEGQDLLVSMTRTGATGPAVMLADRVPAHGTASASGPLFVAFAEGVLTGEPLPTVTPTATHAGLLTLMRDPTVKGLKVQCQVKAGSPQPGA